MRGTAQWSFVEMPEKHDEDETSFEGLISFESSPPPAGPAEEADGGGGVHNAPTTVGHLPESLLEELRASVKKTRKGSPFVLPGRDEADGARSGLPTPHAMVAAMPATLPPPPIPPEPPTRPRLDAFDSTPPVRAALSIGELSAPNLADALTEALRESAPERLSIGAAPLSEEGLSISAPPPPPRAPLFAQEDYLFMPPPPRSRLRLAFVLLAITVGVVASAACFALSWSYVTR